MNTTQSHTTQESSLASLVKRGIQARPQRVILYGPEGVGKTTLASKMPSPIFLDTEEGTAHLDVPRVPCHTMDDIHRAIKSLLSEQHDYKTVVIDTIDWCERMLARKMIQEQNSPKINNIEDFGYGKGFTILAQYMADFLAVLNKLMARGMNVVLLAHSRRVKFEQPDSVGAYDKFEVKLTTKVAPIVKEWSDDILFLNFLTIIQDGKGKGGYERMIYTSPQAPFEAKNRHQLPNVVPADIASLAPIFSMEPPRNTSSNVNDSPTPATQPHFKNVTDLHHEVIRKFPDKIDLIVNGAIRFMQIQQDQSFYDIPAEYLQRILNNPEKAFAAMESISNTTA